MRAGTYNLTGSGRVASWADIASKVFELRNGNADAVKTREHGRILRERQRPISPRPEHSALTLSKLEDAGFAPANWEDSLWPT